MSQRKLPARPRPQPSSGRRRRRRRSVTPLRQSSSVVRLVLAILYPYIIPDPGTDPQLSTAKRQQRTQALNTTLSQGLSNANSPPQRLPASNSKPVSASATRRSNASKPIVGGLPNANKKNERKKNASQRNARMKRFVKHRALLYWTNGVFADKSRPGRPIPALRTEHSQRRLRGSPRQTRRALALHIPEARRSSRGAHVPRAPSRHPHRRAPRITRSSINTQRRGPTSAISPRRPGSRAGGPLTARRGRGQLVRAAPSSRARQSTRGS
jgi:hypothetical protein